LLFSSKTRVLICGFLPTYVTAGMMGKSAITCHAKVLARN
jgi:hypothetical protein